MMLFLAARSTPRRRRSVTPISRPIPSVVINSCMRVLEIQISFGSKTLCCVLRRAPVLGESEFIFNMFCRYSNSKHCCRHGWYIIIIQSIRDRVSTADWTISWHSFNLYLFVSNRFVLVRGVVF